MKWAVWFVELKKEGSISAIKPPFKVKQLLISFKEMSRLKMTRSKAKTYDLPTLEEVEEVITRSKDALGLLGREASLTEEKHTNPVKSSSSSKRAAKFPDEFAAPDLSIASLDMKHMLDEFDEEQRHHRERTDQKRSPRRKSKERKKIYDARESLKDARKLGKNDAPEIGYRGNRRQVLIHELDLEKIHPNGDNYLDVKNTTGFKVVLIGKTGSGKTVTLKSILYEKWEYIPCAQVYSGSEDLNHQYAEFIPDVFIFEEDLLNEEAYKEMIKRQKIALKYLGNPWTAIVWDDIIEDNKTFNKACVKQTYKKGRHWRVLHFLLLQYGMDVKIDIRAQIDGVFMFRETNPQIRERLFNNFSGGIESFKDFCKILDFVTDDFKSLYVHNRGQSSKFEDCVFYYKARNDIPVDFKFGAQECWMYDEEVNSRERKEMVF